MKKLLLILISFSLAVACSKNELGLDRNITYPLRGLSLNKTTLPKMFTGETRRLLVGFTPSEATNKAVQWSSDHPEFVTVDQTGLITAVGLGNATITVTSDENPEIKAACYVTVDAESGFTITYPDMTDYPNPIIMSVGGVEQQLVYQLVPFGSYDTRVTVASSDETIATVTLTNDNKIKIVTSPLKKGDVVVTVASVANPEEQKVLINVKVTKASVTDLKLSTKIDGTNPSAAIAENITVGMSKKAYVVFTTDDADAELPFNSNVNCSSSNSAVATVPAVCSYDPVTRVVAIPITVPSSANTGQTAVITVTADDTDNGTFSATFTVTAAKPAVQSITLNQNISRAVHAGDTVVLTYKVTPADAYVQTVDWSIANDASGNAIATVQSIDVAAKKCVVKIKEDFVFDTVTVAYKGYEKTEVLVTAASTENTSAKASCKLRPYQYVEPWGVMVTDQWGNRMRGCYLAKPATGDDAICQRIYAAVYPTNQSTNYNAWSVSTLDSNYPVVPEVDKIGTMKVFFTATSYPYTYPKISDPNQKFFWVSSSSNKFLICDNNNIASTPTITSSFPNTGDETSSSKTKQMGKTVLCYTVGGATATYTRISLYLPVEGDATGALSMKAIFRFGILLRSDKNPATAGNENNWGLPPYSGNGETIYGGMKICNLGGEDGLTGTKVTSGKPYWVNAQQGQAADKGLDKDFYDARFWPWPADAPDVKPEPVIGYGADGVTELGRQVGSTPPAQRPRRVPVDYPDYATRGHYRVLNY